jgi:hypothetical protein
VLFTNDGPWQLRCGKIPGVLATLDFGSGKDKLNFFDQVHILLLIPNLKTFDFSESYVNFLVEKFGFFFEKS